MKSKVTLIITSFNRPDLLDRTINSLLNFWCYPFEDFIIIEDSGNEDMNLYLIQKYSHLRLILHNQNKGAYESIDEAYSYIKTPYVFHCEDDWEFYKGGFIEPAIKIMESNPEIMQVNLSNEENMPIMYTRKGYGIMGSDVNNFWHGFTCRPSIRSMAGYERTKPWTQYKQEGDDLSLHEYRVGQAYYKLGYKAAVLNEYFCTHIGRDRCTWHK
jgi:glycosyltransferase involved in cell wall biosynthesis